MVQCVIYWLAAVAASVTAEPPATPSPIDPAVAAAAFATAERVADADGGRLWGVSLNGPIVLVDPATRQAAASRRDPDGALTLAGGVFLGSIPDNLGVANTAFDWGGERWTMVLWPLPDGQSDRDRILMHELWHRIQGSIGLPPRDPPCPHLDTAEGRLWMRMELRALARALRESGEERERALSDALAFRLHRRALFDGSAAAEIALENNEGLAEYTGVMLALDTPASRLDRAARGLVEAEAQPTYVRSFAYGTGSAYGLLADAQSIAWHRGHTPDTDLASLLRSRDLPGGPENRAAAYGFAEVRAEELQRERRRLAMLADLRTRLVDGRRARLPLQKMNFQFDPREVVPLEPEGTVYPGLTLRDVWGTLTVRSGGALVGKKWDYVAVPVHGEPAPHPAGGEAWALELADGWQWAEGGRDGEWTIRPRE